MADALSLAQEIVQQTIALLLQPRPVYYTRDQLDELYEKIIVNFCMARYGQELNPIPTEALLQLLEECPRRRSNRRPAGQHRRGYGIL